MGKRKSKKKKSKFLLYSIVYLFFGILMVLTVFYVSLPNVKELKGSIKIDRKIKKENSYITIPYTVGEKNRNWVPLARISKNLQNAVIVAEDIEFYNHGGFSLSEIEESIKRNLKEGRFARGGSTITQQLMKNVYLSGEKTLLRKIKEAILAYKAEKVLSKDRIFEIYLNIIEWGYGVYGAKMAADAYFNKKPSQLTVKESAYLASLIPNPVRYSRAKEGSRLEKYLEKRQNAILWWMDKAGYLDIDKEKFRSKRKAASTKSRAKPARKTSPSPSKKQKYQSEEEELFMIIEEFQPEEVFKGSQGSQAPALEDQN